jgi:hypothetical protein
VHIEPSRRATGVIIPIAPVSVPVLVTWARIIVLARKNALEVIEVVERAKRVGSGRERAD